MSEPLLASAEDELTLARVAALAREGAAGVAPLVALFAHRSWAVRRGVVAALGVGDAARAALLCRALVEQRQDEPTVAGLVDSLSSIALDAGAVVRELLSHPDVAVLCDAAQIAGRRRDEAAVPALVLLTQHADDNVALAAMESLGRVGGSDAVVRLLEIVQSGNFFRAFPAVEVLGRLRDARAVPVLVGLLAQALYANEAARALGRIGSLAGVAPLLLAMERGSESLLRAGAQSLVAIDELASQSVGPASAARAAVRRHATLALRDKLVRALPPADGAEQVAVGRMLVWLADDSSIADLVSLLGAREEMSKLALEGLAELGALADPRVLQLLETGSSELRARMLPALSGVAGAGHAVAACLDDEQPGVRALACHALARGNDRAAVPRLFGLLTDPDLGVVHAAIGAIQSLGSDQTRALALAAAASSDAGERRAGLRIVTYMGYDESLALCIAAIASDDARLRDIAVAALPALEDERALGLLLDATRHAAARTRAAAVRALGHVAPNADTERALAAALGATDAWERYYACQALGRLGVASAVPALIALLDDPAEHVKLGAVEALASIPGDAAGDALAQSAASEDSDVRRAAITGLGERRDARSQPIVLAALTSAEPSLRLVAASSIARFPGSEAILGGVAARDADAEVRRAAIELLAARSSPESTATLVALLVAGVPPDPIVAALRLGGDARIPALLAALDGADDAVARVLLAVLARAESRLGRAALDTAFDSANVAVRRATARVLGLVLDDRAKSSLARAASADSDAEVRRIAAAAIA